MAIVWIRFTLRALNKPAEIFAGPKRPFLIAILLVTLTFALFAPAISYDFVNYDDDLYVYDNPVVQHGLSVSGLHYALTSYDAGTWAPITWLSYELDSTLFGARASSYHATNILLHVAAGLILFFALQLMLKSFWTSTVVAGIFLVHPLRTESVVWIAERKDVLCALFWALGLLAYWFYVKKPSLARWMLVFLCLLAGVMSKMMMVTFPFVLLLLDVWPLNRTNLDWPNLRARAWPLLREKIPLFAVCGLVVFLTSRALHSVGTLNSVGADISTKLLRVPENYVFYLGKIFWPANLSVLYPNEKVQTSAALLAGLLLVVITVLTVWQMRKRPWLLVGWLWFLGTLVPVIGFVTFGHFFVGDRYTYIPSIGLTLAVVVTLEHLLRRFLLARWAGATAVVALCALATSADVPRWRNTFTLYDAALRVGPHHVTYNNRGTAFLKVGDMEHAMADFNAAIQMKSDYATALSNRGSLWTDLGNIEAAIKDCSEAIKCDPELADAWNNRGNAYNRTGEYAKALADYDQSIKLKPDKAVYYNNRAAAHFLLKQYVPAKADLEKCSQLGGQPHPGLVHDLDEAMKQSNP